MSAQPPPGRGEPPQNIATAITEISERATLLVREEIELAKTEVTEKVNKLARGAVVGVAAGIFFVMALIFILVGCAWLIYFYLPVGDFAYFWGFFAMAVILIVLGVLAGLIAARVLKRSSPPVPTMAIEEAQRIRESVSTAAHDPIPGAPVAPPAPPVPAPAPTPTSTTGKD
ncbi:MAG: phage holin family protein [Solirubrobacteraceae bacterium]